MNKTQRMEGIVLNRTKLKEQDLIITFLNDRGEKVQAIAAGARKPSSKLAARSDYFCTTDFLVRYGKGSLGYMAEASLVSARPNLRRCMEATSAAMAITEVSRYLCFEDMEDPLMFAMLDKALTIMDGLTDRAHLELLVAAYIFKALAHLGWRPELLHCVACGDEAIAYFDVHAGGAICNSCAVDRENPVDANLARWIGYLLQATFQELAACSVDELTACSLASLAHLWSQTHLDVRLHALEFLMGTV